MANVVESVIKFPYKRSLGPVLGAFMTGLTEQRIIGIRNGSKVLVPPLEWDPETGAELAHDFVDVGPAGTVESWTWVAKPTEQHPLDVPFAMALVKLDGADTCLVHAVDAGSPDAMSTGMRVAPRWKAERQGHITDLEAFVPGEEPQGGGGGGAEEPVAMMEYNASITYLNPVPTNIVRGDQANAEGRFLGFECPECGRMYTSAKSFCPVDNIELTAEHELDLPQTGVVSNYTIIEPVQYPGQTETEKFARVHVKLDGVEIVLGFQGLIDVPVEEVRVGMKVAAVWASEGERTDLDPRMEGRLIGWMPTGEPDVDDPDLVNRMP